VLLRLRLPNGQRIDALTARLICLICRCKGMSESKVFYFTVKASNSGDYAVCVKPQT
jgi:hypothetical protein